MKDAEIVAPGAAAATSEIDIGRPVEWMIDPERQDIVLGVTYEFTETGDRQTVWYTPNKRRAKGCIFVSELPA
jgi:hypothetical protein